MMGLFKRAGVIDTAALGGATLALRVASGQTVPKQCVGVVFDKGGHTRRVADGAKLSLAENECAYCFHPGPYQVDLVPFAQAPELGLRLSFAVDCPDPRVAQQRFDLYLMSEAADRVDLVGFGAAVEAALQRELAQGNLALPPCTSLEEWNVFRAGFNQLLYTRFGISVDDCVPVDLAVDYAQVLLDRAATALSGAPAVTAKVVPAARPFDAPASDARALRRLFLELPCVMHGLRMAVLPPGQALFQQHKALLQRLDGVSLSVSTMPALELVAPGVPLTDTLQSRRAHHSVAACIALDEGWALLARLALAGVHQLDAMFDEADRIVANLERSCAARRVPDFDSEVA